jgi:hypothetical protein
MVVTGLLISDILKCRIGCHYLSIKETNMSLELMVIGYILIAIASALFFTVVADLGGIDNLDKLLGIFWVVSVPIYLFGTTVNFCVRLIKGE